MHEPSHEQFYRVMLYADLVYVRKLVFQSALFKGAEFRMRVCSHIFTIVSTGFKSLTALDVQCELNFLMFI